MIKANELRVGNCVDYFGDKVKILSICSIEDIVCLDIPFEEFEHTQASIENIIPIQLTEEILLKCGFNWIGLGGMVKDNYFIRHEGCLTMCMKSGVLLTTVHQLQNLYFALTKQELEIKL